MMRILLVDDHPVVRQGIRTILAERIRGAVLTEASDAASAMALIESGEWDLVLADISLPDGSGLELIKQLRRIRPALPAVVVSMHPAAQFARPALSAGAAAYVTKDSEPEELVAVIEEVRHGREYVGPGVRVPPAQVHQALSDREYQVLRLLASGHSVSDIARDLGLSVKTVSTYRGRMLDKLGMKTNADVVRYAIQSGLLDA